MEKVIYQKHPSFLLNELYKKQKVIKAESFKRKNFIGRDPSGQ
jgi:hypothetical protein